MHVSTAPVKSTAGQVIKDITVNQKLLDGNTILIVYYCLILVFFMAEFMLLTNAVQYRKKRSERGEIKPYMLLAYHFYNRFRDNSYTAINMILFSTCIVMILVNGTVEPREIVAVSISILLFSWIIQLFRTIFLGTENYENESVTNYINLIFYILLGTYFCYFVSFLSRPNLLIAYTGLIVALFLVFSIMLRAIFNPQILKRKTKDDILYSTAFGIIKGMFALLVLEILILYMMVYACWRTDHGYYISSVGRVLDAWDMLYYTLISFSTIGYGDIVPIRPNGSLFGEFTAMVISICAFFSSACFAGAVISSANSIAQETRERLKRQKNTKKTGPTLSTAVSSFGVSMNDLSGEEDRLNEESRREPSAITDLFLSDDSSVCTCPSPKKEAGS